MNLKPLYDKIVVEVVEDNEPKTIIVVQDKKLLTGKVIKAGKGYWQSGRFVDLVISDGDLVVYPSYAGIEYLENGKKYTILSQSEILGTK